VKRAEEQTRHDADAAIAIFEEAATLNLEDHYREGCILRLPAYGQAVMTGDLHGHRKNFEKLQKYAMLDRVRARHVVLHEIIHAEPASLAEQDHSHEVLLAAAKYKCDFPEQVHFMQSNHELSQLTGYLIAKNGRGVIQAFNEAVATAYGKPQAGGVLAAINAFIASFPIAIRTENRIWLSHSLPNVHNMDEFDLGVFGRSLTREELAANRTVFHLVWGRRHTQAHIDALADALDVDVFITGHQPQDTGFKLVFDRLIILASDHNHGSFLPFDLAKQRSAEELLDAVRKFVAVA
jgi:hypothetical protein